MIDIEELLTEYLSEQLDLHVSGDVPVDKPDEFVTFEVTGGGFGDLVLDYPTVAIQCWSDSRANAKNLARKVDTLIKKMPSVYFDITSAERNSLYNFPDPQSHKPRYQIVVDFIVQQ